MTRWCPRCLRSDGAWRQIAERVTAYIDGIGWADRYQHRCGQSVYVPRVQSPAQRSKMAVS